MAKKKQTGMKRVSEAMGNFSLKVTEAAGSSWAFAVAFAVIVLWGVSGPIFGFSDTWQLVINTGTTIVTFLMVFLIQRSQNKETKALEMKLNEIVAAIEGASNHLIDVEDASEEELETLQRHYRKLARLADKESDVTCSHSVEEAGNRHEAKKDAASGTRRKRRLSPRGRAGTKGNAAKIAPH